MPSSAVSSAEISVKIPHNRCAALDDLHHCLSTNVQPPQYRIQMHLSEKRKRKLLKLVCRDEGDIWINDNKSELFFSCFSGLERVSMHLVSLLMF